MVFVVSFSNSNCASIGFVFFHSLFVLCSTGVAWVSLKEPVVLRIYRLSSGNPDLNYSFYSRLRYLSHKGSFCWSLCIRVIASIPFGSVWVNSLSLFRLYDICLSILFWGIGHLVVYILRSRDILVFHIITPFQNTNQKFINRISFIEKNLNPFEIRESLFFYLILDKQNVRPF